MCCVCVCVFARAVSVLLRPLSMYNVLLLPPDCASHLFRGSPFIHEGREGTASVIHTRWRGLN